MLRLNRELALGHLVCHGKPQLVERRPETLPMASGDAPPQQCGQIITGLGTQAESVGGDARGLSRPCRGAGLVRRLAEAFERSQGRAQEAGLGQRRIQVAFTGQGVSWCWG